MRKNYDKKKFYGEEISKEKITFRSVLTSIQHYFT